MGTGNEEKRVRGSPPGVFWPASSHLWSDPAEKPGLATVPGQGLREERWWAARRHEEAAASRTIAQRFHEG